MNSIGYKSSKVYRLPSSSQNPFASRFYFCQFGEQVLRYTPIPPPPPPPSPLLLLLLLLSLAFLSCEGDKGMTGFGQVVIGPPGSGKTTYCNGMSQFLKLIGRQ
ncbi:hypothetical protein IEQ34_018073 [Dendrobium chrysotoxum]|uniref:Uncharacterized protein n=1 Tax=Dendrobium chrysotoxum TaxID=161865 RepID=A0AAV7FVT8_DENCH|nr:hypothetical protein IEQ34_018073 [Dendrobium chrysotoxum]